MGRSSTVPIQEADQKRHLRSRENSRIDTSLFNFENDSESLDPDHDIRIVNSHPEGHVLLSKIELPEINFKTELVLCENNTDGSSRERSFRRSTISKNISSIKDPLADELYLNYHRRMEKEEKKMTNRDREKIYVEADKMRSQLESLNQNDWNKVLPSITYIRDPRDSNEMKQKREWTIHSLTTLLTKFDEWKKREDRILGKQRSHVVDAKKYINDLRLYTKLNKFDFIGDSDTEDEDDDLTVNQLRKKRFKARTKQFGPRITIKFGENLIIAEPFRPTRIDNVLNHLDSSR